MNAMVKFCQCLSLAISELLPWRQVVTLLASLSSIGEQYIKFECWGGGGRGGGGERRRGEGGRGEGGREGGKSNSCEFKDISSHHHGNRFSSPIEPHGRVELTDQGQGRGYLTSTIIYFAKLTTLPLHSVCKKN